MGTAIHPVRSPWTRWAVTTLGVVLFLAACDQDRVLTSGGTGEASGDVRAPRATVAVIYFHNATDPADDDHLGRMLKSLLFSELTRQQDLKVVNPQRLHAIAATLGGLEIGDRERAIEIARALALDTMVLGEVNHAATVTATAEIVDVHSGRVLATHQAGGREASELFEIAAALGRQVSETLIAAPLELEEALPLTASLESYRAFVQGEDLLQTHDFAGAVERFGESVAIDPIFALAHYRLSLAASWQGAQDLARSASEEAVRLADDLPQWQRDLFESMRLYNRGRFSEALPKIEALLVEDPENKEALYLLSEMYLHSGIDTHVARATEAMLILESLDPSFILLHNHLAIALVIQDRWQEAFVHLDRWIAEEPEVISLRHVALAMGGRLEEVPELQEPVRRVNDNYGIAIAMLQDRWQYAEELLGDEAGEGYQSSWTARTHGAFLAYRGRFDAAREAYREAASQHDAPDHEGIQNGIPGSALRGLAELAELQGDLRQARADAEAAVRLQPSLPAPRYLAGRLAARDGDVTSGEEHLLALRRVAARSRGTTVILFEQALEAEIFLAEGRAEHALEKYQNVVGSRALMHDFYAHASSSGALFRDGLARACRALWDQACETAALEGLLDSGFERVDHPALYVRALFRLGELQLEAGDVERGREYFERFLDHWGQADWELGQVSEAREHLARRR